MKVGDIYISETTVTNDLTAIEMGSGDMMVYATPAMVALMENAAMLCIAHDLEEGLTTVGIEMQTTHLKASALGAQIRAEAELIEIDGRRLEFKVSAYEGETLIGEGKHVRFIVNKEKFLSKLK